MEPLLEPDSNNIFIEAYQHGWVWSIPLHTGWTSVGAVVDNRTGQEGIRRLGARAFLAEQLSQTNHTSGRLRAAAWAAQPQVVRDWSYSADRLAGPGYVIAGDAACFVDPLFSSGVHLALMSGVMAAAYAATALKQDERTDEAPILESAAQVYQELYFKEYRQFREMARLFYSSNLTAESYFWEARRITDTEEYSPRQSFIQAVAGQPPRGYERAVLERGDAPGQFISSVRTVESDRAERAHRMSALRSDTQRNQLLWAVPRLADGVTVSRRPGTGSGRVCLGLHPELRLPARGYTVQPVGRQPGVAGRRPDPGSDAGGTVGARAGPNVPGPTGNGRYADCRNPVHRRNDRAARYRLAASAAVRYNHVRVAQARRRPARRGQDLP